jgi:hypothetical protein
MMMKKVLILLMVLGLASVTYAAPTVNLSWSVDTVELDINETAVVTLNADNNANYNNKWVGNTAGTIAEIVDLEVLDAAGEDGTGVSQAPTYDGWWMVKADDQTGTVLDSIETGAQYRVTIKGLAAGTYGLNSDYYGENGGTNDVLEITVIPEPITIALLGLGGLLLRRRK